MHKEQKTVRTSDVVETSEIEMLLNRIKNSGVGEIEAVTAIGYKNASGLLSEIRRVGLGKRVILMALKGFIAERGIGGGPKIEVFGLTYEESELLFDATRKAREIWPKREAVLKSIQARIAMHMTKL